MKRLIGVMMALLLLATGCSAGWSDEDWDVVRSMCVDPFQAGSGCVSTAERLEDAGCTSRQATFLIGDVIFNGASQANLGDRC